MSSLSQRAEINGLRGIAVAAVIIYHAMPWLLQGGFLGVDVFFVISGYLITRILIADRDPRGGLLRFYERRVRRLVPALSIVLLASTIGAWLLLPPAPLVDYGYSLAAAATFVSNIFFWQHSSYFDVAAIERPLLHTWSLGVEEQFYILYPLVLLWLLRWPRRVAMSAIGAGALLSFVLSLLLWNTRPEPVFYLLPARAWELLVGAAINAIAQNRLDAIPARVRDGACGIALAGLIAILAFAGPGNLSPAVQAGVVLSTAILIAMGYRGAIQRALSWAPLVGLGLISYSAYLWHQPVFVFARMYALAPIRPIEFAGLTALTLILAAISWRWIETPARDPGNGSRRMVFGAAAAGILLFTSAGFLLASARVNAWRSGPAGVAAETANKAMAVDRQANLRAGTCHFNRKFGEVRDPSVFRSRWNCWGKDGFIVGDSHAADVSLALRANGFDLGQFTWAGCSLVPRLMLPECRKGMDRIRSELLAKGGSPTIILVNQFEPEELTAAAFREMMAYWSLPGARIWLFTAMPEFPDLRGVRWRAARYGLLNSQLPARPDVEAAIASEARATRAAREWAAVHVINSRQVFCGLTRGACDWQLGERSLIYDTGHLTVAGARMFGAELIRTYPFVREAVPATSVAVPAPAWASAL